MRHAMFFAARSHDVRVNPNSRFEGTLIAPDDFKSFQQGPTERGFVP